MISMREISEKMLNFAKVLNGRLQDKEKVVQRKTKRSFSIIEEQAAEELIFQIYLCTSSRHRKRRSVVSIWSFLANSCRTKIPFFPIPLILPKSDPHCLKRHKQAPDIRSIYSDCLANLFVWNIKILYVTYACLLFGILFVPLFTNKEVSSES